MNFPRKKFRLLNYDLEFLVKLEEIIKERVNSQSEDSYISSLSQQGLPRVAQKVGEEALETVIEAIGLDNARFLEEAADLLFHYLILLHKKGYNLAEISKVLSNRHRLLTKTK